MGGTLQDLHMHTEKIQQLQLNGCVELSRFTWPALLQPGSASQVVCTAVHLPDLIAMVVPHLVRRAVVDVIFASRSSAGAATHWTAIPA